MNVAVILKRFEQGDDVRTFEKGRFELVNLGAMTIGRSTYEPGWRWSQHLGASTGATHWHVEHVGLVVTGSATAAMAEGSVIEMRAGDLFYILSRPHDCWVVGGEPYVSLHFLSADHYARGDRKA